jgi:hypothetical protein
LRVPPGPVTLTLTWPRHGPGALSLKSTRTEVRMGAVAGVQVVCWELPVAVVDGDQGMARSVLLIVWPAR